MYFPFSVNLKENHEQAEMLQDSFINNKYYYLVENGDHNIDCRLNSLDSFKSAKKVSDMSSCDLVLLGKSRNQMMPPHFGLKFIDCNAIVIEFICYLFSDDSIQNDINMLIQYLKIKHSDTKKLIMPASIQFDSSLYKIIKEHGKKIITWE